MIFKILMLGLIVAGVIYWIKQPRRVQAAAPYQPLPARRPIFIALCIATALAAAGSVLSALLWMGGVAGGVTGGGYRGEADFLLPVSGSLLALAIACAVGAFLKRRG
ncbi:preprotein translocase subunit TatB [Achromobacter seleniivolatilans]|uniref:Preprotein translocase subunit TatB n=1 Tax=Achromobacter seleniivolatilans TaxID=3047478 RepID=A0ABY9M3Z6_9BURK|nr:preprotein translocase subunit TatB [Achromobacter sp. R39]WMD21435.1 preprotein translocase subunit TatB [Achromobacter sp. R39]